MGSVKVKKINDAPKMGKVNVGDDSIRKAYYGATDGLQGLNRAVAKLKDKKLSAQLDAANKAFDEFSKMLSANYIWD